MVRTGVEPLDLLREMRKLKPSVVHFAGHGDQTGLCFLAPDGTTKIVSNEALAATIAAAGDSVRLVVLNSCYSEAQAGVLLSLVDNVLATSGTLNDDAAREFAVNFYTGLGDGDSIGDAYLKALNVRDWSVADRPQLYGDTVAADLRLAPF